MGIHQDPPKSRVFIGSLGQTGALNDVLAPFQCYYQSSKSDDDYKVLKTVSKDSTGVYKLQSLSRSENNIVPHFSTVAILVPWDDEEESVSILPRDCFIEQKNLFSRDTAIPRLTYVDVVSLKMCMWTNMGILQSGLLSDGEVSSLTFT